MLNTGNQKFLLSVQSDEFLPISRWTSLAGISLMGTVSAGVSLASFVKYYVTVKATSAVGPTGEIRLVQPSIDGTVKTIFVKENQIVKRGDAIARLDDLELHIKNSQLQVNIQGGNLQLAQINAQIKALDNQIDAENKVIERTIFSAKANLAHHKWQYQQQRIKAQSESLSAEANLQKAKVELDADRERDRYSSLVKEGAIAQRQLDEKQLIVLQAKSAAVAAEQKAEDIATNLNPSGEMVASALSKIAQESAKGESSIAAFIREKNTFIHRQLEMRNQKGVVSTISTDAITSQTNNTGATTPVVSYFEVTIKPENISFGNGDAVRDATADIISKQETAMQFLLRKARLITDL